MSHFSHEPDADESLLEHAWYKCLGCKQTWSTLFALGQQTGTRDPLLVQNQMQVQYSAAAAEPQNVPHVHLATCLIRSGTSCGCCAHISARYARRATRLYGRNGAHRYNHDLAKADTSAGAGPAGHCCTKYFCQ